MSFTAKIQSTWSTNQPFSPLDASLPSVPSLGSLYCVMGLQQYEHDNETRLVHFCLHLYIKDKAPEVFDVVSGIWYVKEPNDLGRPIKSTPIPWTGPPPWIPRLVYIYFNQQLMPGGRWWGWKIADIQYTNMTSCFDVIITKLPK